MKQSTINNQQLTIPSHIAVIMDGNRRWAKERGLPVLAGHKRVTDEILEPLIEYAAKRGIKYLTFWAWSTENWKRDEKEVKGIMRLFKLVIQRKLERFHKKGVRVKTIGDISQFDPEIRKALENVVEKTKNNQTITAVFALNYGGRDEIIRAVNRLCADYCSSEAKRSRELTNENFSTLRQLADRSKNNNVTMEQFSNYLDTSGIPDPEIIVRTGGEQRLSGFLPWQSVYSEFFFPTWYMPEFTPEKLDEVLEEYEKRQRRFGK